MAETGLTPGRVGERPPARPRTGKRAGRQPITVEFYLRGHLAWPYARRRPSRRRLPWSAEEKAGPFGRMSGWAFPISAPTRAEAARAGDPVEHAKAAAIGSLPSPGSQRECRRAIGGIGRCGRRHTSDSTPMSICLPCRARRRGRRRYASTPTRQNRARRGPRTSARTSVAPPGLGRSIAPDPGFRLRSAPAPSGATIAACLRHSRFRYAAGCTIPSCE
jgi:hypothetical protein